MAPETDLIEWRETKGKTNPWAYRKAGLGSTRLLDGGAAALRLSREVWLAFLHTDEQEGRFS